ncbi:NAD(P)-binding protein [Dendrothele bispora CBS 962.96]|uniref:NAD(P)-binding protein n=1 Tax=Dendrothele bispora (strain CBS 962.96) TaxID=1314807 RepID=A0A4S8L357_DENBC|nr:NAD(P)-binding protein [Dendrothele bispora CBS 962.96]
MKVLVLGASGFIGFSAAQALSRAGHVVYGQTRSPEKAKRLAAEEIHPITCSANSTDWHHLIPTLDVIVNTLGGEASYPDSVRGLLNSVAEAAKTLRPPGSPKLSWIYTSGTWVHGFNGGELNSDTTPVDLSGSHSVELVKWRPACEQEVIKNEVLNGIVVRPSLLYGRSGSIIGLMFERLKKTGKVTWPGKPKSGGGLQGGRLSLIHQDDLADFYVRAAEKAPLIGGLIFDVSNDVTESLDYFLQRMVDIAGVQGPYEYTEPQNVFELAISTEVLVKPYLARSVLGWQPKKLGLIDGLELYWKAYLASVE